jgi:pimeloyl-ACP methyl ester carboxylesterase
MHRFRDFAARLLAIASLALIADKAFAGDSAFVRQDCPPAAAVIGARCGHVQVPENHARPRGRQIALAVIVLPATSPNPNRKRAQYDLEGGPGFAVRDFLDFYASDGAIYRERDIVLADMRGTGGSNALRCAAIEEMEKRDPWAPLYPPEMVAECAQQLSRTSDLSQYGTGAAARDIDLVRRALGYEQLDLNAVSYGTTLALRYIADFPRAVHAAALMGTVPAGRTPPRFHAQAATHALTLLREDCAAECLQHHGDVQRNFDLARARLARESPLRAEIFSEKVRTRLYAPMSTRSLPALLARAAQGDLSGFENSAGPGGRVFADGAYLSITCAESLARMDVAAAIASADATPFQAYRLRRQRDACARWPVAPVDGRLLHQPVNRVPTLFIGGTRDPVSPSEWSLDVSQAFERHRRVEAHFGAHVFEGLSGLDTCLDATILRLFDKADVDLDVSCFETMKPEPFTLQ